MNRDDNNITDVRFNVYRSGLAGISEKKQWRRKTRLGL